MNRVVLFEQDRINSDRYALLDNFRREHLIQHLKIKKGDQLKVSVLGRGLGLAEIEEIQPERIQLKLLCPLEAPLLPEIHLYVATSRPPTMKKIVEHGTTLGVTHFHFFTAQLSQKSYLDSKVLLEENLNQLASLGISQSGKIWNAPQFFKYKDLFEAKDQIQGKHFLLSVKNGPSLLQAKPNFQGPLHFWIGPERGWTNQEEEILIKANIQAISLSQHILRVETAAFALLSQLEMLQLN
ncbi:MAG: hypothetical protein CME63_15220 [Halobacteriovoraceae bacterium]|nr:hypothetical protein [Halobacteriovoraceae bacterium]|tara:strand:- start:149434 stop:150153 length:720 start_codon:yes stop_codon:yes gene_type:complete